MFFDMILITCEALRMENGRFKRINYTQIFKEDKIGEIDWRILLITEINDVGQYQTRSFNILFISDPPPPDVLSITHRAT